MLVFGVYFQLCTSLSSSPRKALAKLFPPAPLAVVNGVNGMNGQAVTNGNSPGVGRWLGKPVTKLQKKTPTIHAMKVNEDSQDLSGRENLQV